ncbi:MAG: PAS domain S-box protein [Salinivirgaceae bacterium]|jgi:PAS domain S-box-containing protein|nr:PAS domain S-box protein [Salinivirgaceae bacterium]
MATSRSQENRYLSQIEALQEENETLRNKVARNSSNSNELKYQNVFYNAPIGILHYNEEGVITDCNDVFVNIIGSTKQRLIGFNMLKELRDTKLQNAVQESLSTGISSYEDLYKSVTADKQTRVRITFKGITDTLGQIVEGMGIIEDITLQYNARIELEKSEHTYRSIFEQNAVGIAHMAPDATLLRANSRFAAIIGRDMQSIYNVDFKSITHPDDQKLDRRYIIKALKNEIDDFSFEKRYIKPDNSIVWVKLYGKVIRDNANKLQYAIIAISDITQQKEVQAELKGQKEKYYKLYSQYLEQNRELKNYVHQLEEANKNLKTAKERAEESNRLKTAFLTNMSHDIRTPMNGILGFTDMLKNSDLANDLSQRYTELISQSGHRLLNVIDSLIDMSKIEAGINEINLEEIDIIEHIAKIAANFEQKTTEKGLQLIKNYDSKHVKSIVTDPLKLEQILTNVLDNALKFTKKGSIKISIDTSDSSVLISVTDTGFGIESEYQQVIFERFRQAPANSYSVNEGAGLGLAVAKGLTLQLNGEIWVESIKNEGSTFYISLPKNELNTSVQPSKSLIDKHQNEILDNLIAPKILIVEDEPLNYILIEELLSPFGYNILHAVDGQMALEIVKKTPDISLVLMDIKLQGMNGIEATKRIRQQNNDVKIIAISAYTKPEIFTAETLSIFDDYMTKPIEAKKLIEKVRRSVK